MAYLSGQFRYMASFADERLAYTLHLQLDGLNIQHEWYKFFVATKQFLPNKLKITLLNTMDSGRATNELHCSREFDSKEMTS
jgi:hypothetical protein